jgi:hypothetical protein
LRRAASRGFKTFSFTVLLDRSAMGKGLPYEYCLGEFGDVVSGISLVTLDGACWQR